MTHQPQACHHGQGKSWQNEHKEDGIISESWSSLAKPDVSKNDPRLLQGGKYTATSPHLGSPSLGEVDLFMAPLVDLL